MGGLGALASFWVASGSKQLAAHRFDDEESQFGDPGRLLGDLGLEMASMASFHDEHGAVWELLGPKWALGHRLTMKINVLGALAGFWATLSSK